MKKYFLSIFICSAVLIASAQDSTLYDYTGKYKFPDGSMVPEVEITLNENTLTITAVLGSATLDKVSRDTFLIPSYGNAMVFFYRNSENKVNAIKIDIGSNVIEGKKDGLSLGWIREYFREAALADIRKK